MIKTRACSVAVTCIKGSTPTPIGTPPDVVPTRTLKITNDCDPDCGEHAFHITITGNNPCKTVFIRSWRQGEPADGHSISQIHS